MKNIICSLSITLYSLTFAQTDKLVQKNENNKTFCYEQSSTYARGLLMDNNRLFISNANGSVYYYNTKSDKSMLIFKLESIDELRDLEKSEDHILALHSGTDGKIAKIGLDGSIQIIEKPEWKGVFLDGFDFIGKQGFMMGDPTEGFFNLYHTSDGGITWEQCEGKIEAKEGEAGFAASGTNVQMLNSSTYIFVSGGTVSHFFKSKDNGKTWLRVLLPYYPGESSGAYSICFADDKRGVIVGGDYASPNLKMNTSFFTEDGGESWFNAKTQARGYRSCAYFANGIYYACGTNGIDYSTNYGVDWKPFANGSFFSLTSTPTQLIATAKNGTIEFFDLIRTK
ncbi:MAG: hypothetical protein NWR50_06160 [Crocinitomicaceae bacterium]|nr:hypothetical protein [Crocinitomicaceae bacterium]